MAVAIIVSLSVRIIIEEYDLVQVIVKASLLAIYCSYWVFKIVKKPLIKDDDQSYLKLCSKHTLMKLANKKSNELLHIYSLENQSFLNSAPANLKPKSLRDLVGN